MKSINIFIATTILFLVTLTATSAFLYHPQSSPLIADREALLELALKDAVKGLPQNNTTRELIILLVPTIASIRIPSSIQGVSIQVLNQEEIDALSKIKPVDYISFRSITKSDPNTAEVSLSYLLFYRANDPDLNYVNGGKAYNCTKQSGNWVISSSKGWVP
jgi:hypothetical protein